MAKVNPESYHPEDPVLSQCPVYLLSGSFYFSGVCFYFTSAWVAGCDRNACIGSRTGLSVSRLQDRRVKIPCPERLQSSSEHRAQSQEPLPSYSLWNVWIIQIQRCLSFRGWAFPAKVSLYWWTSARDICISVEKGYAQCSSSSNAWILPRNSFREPG